MIYFNYNPYFCFQRQKIINYLKTGGLIPKGGGGLIGRIIRGIAEGMRHPISPKVAKTITKEVTPTTTKRITDLLSKAKNKLNEIRKKSDLTNDDKNEIKKLENLIKDLEVKANEKIRTIKTSNTAGQAGVWIGRGIDVTLVAPIAAGIIGDLGGNTVVPSLKSENGPMGHTLLGIGSTIPGRIINSFGNQAGITFFPTTAEEAYKNNNSSNKGTYDYGYGSNPGVE